MRAGYLRHWFRRRVVTEDRFLSGGSLAHSGKEAVLKKQNSNTLINVETLKLARNKNVSQ